MSGDDNFKMNHRKIEFECVDLIIELAQNEVVDEIL
jgi:hypothetical protein